MMKIFWLWTFTLALWGSIWHGAAVQAAEQPLTCALVPAPDLDLPNSVALGMLEVKLTEDSGLALLERAEIEKALKELSLQQALAAEGVAQRRALGTLLKARLLLILRAVERKSGDQVKRWIELTACDTESGLRIYQEPVTWDDSLFPEVAADMLVYAIGRARERLAVPVRTVVAVAPLVSDDLLHRYDAMQDAYARVMGQYLVRAPGVKMVEVTEARALLDEQRLTASDAARRSMAAYFVSGRYRNNGSGDQRRIDLSFELRRGETVLDRQTTTSLSPGREAGYINALSRKWLGLMETEGAGRFDREEEITELIRQANALGEIGDDQHALGPIEAALLVRPESGDLCRRAAHTCARIANASFYSPELDPKAYAERARQGLEAARRGCEHLEHFLVLGEDRKWNGGKPLASLPEYDDMRPQSLHSALEFFWRAGKQIAEARHADPGTARLVSELGKAKRELMLAHYARMAARGQTNMADYWESHDVVYDRRTDPVSFSRTTQHDYIDYVLFDCTPIDEPIEETFAARLRAISLCRRMMGASALRYCEIYASYHLPLAESGYQKFLGQLEAISADAEWKAMIRRLRLQADVEGRKIRQQQKIFEDFQFRPAPREESRPAAPAVPVAPAAPPMNPLDDFQLLPIPEVKHERSYFAGWIPAGDKDDLLWTANDLFIMRHKGKLERLYQSEEYELFIEPEDPIRCVVYDGRYAWAVQKDRVMVVDPQTGALDRVDAKNGMPPGEMVAAPLGPGRVCVVGAMDRAWCATVAYAPGGKSRVDIFHEARLQTAAWNDPRLAFRPTFAVALGEPGGASAPRVLVGRACPGRASHLALLLDPARRTAQIVPGRISNMLRASAPTVHGGSAWWIENNADLLAVDYFTHHKDKPPAPELDQAALDAISAKNIAEAKAQGKKTTTIIIPGQVGLEVEDITSQPNREFTRLVRFGAPHWRPEVVHNSVLKDNFYDECADLEDRVKAKVGFLDGRCYALGDNNDLWWVDLERGRSVRLRGFMKGDDNDLRKRVFQSNHYGLVLQKDLDGIKGANCFQFVPRFDPAALRTELDGGNITRREVQAQDPLERREVVIRAFKDWQKAPNAFTTMTAPIDGEALLLEPDAMPRNTVMALVAADQREAEVRKLLRDGIMIYILGQDEVTREVKSGDAACLFRLEREELDKGPAGVTRAAIQDALGRPLAGAEVQLGYVQKNYLHSTNRTTLHLRLGGFRTDAQGWLELPLLRFENEVLPPKQVTIRHPDYGDAVVNGCFPQPSLKELAEGVRISLPLVPRNSPEHTRALRGVVMDKENKPVAGALVWCSRVLTAATNQAHAFRETPVVCDGEGRFTIYPLSLSSATAPRYGAGDRFTVLVQHPAQPDLPLLSTVLDNRREQVIRWDEGLRPHRFVIQDESGHPVTNPKNYLALDYHADDAKGQGMGLYRRDMGTCLNQDLLLRPGFYHVHPAGSWPVDVHITPDAPRDIVVRLKANQLASHEERRARAAAMTTTSPLVFEPAAGAPPSAPGQPQYFIALLDGTQQPLPEVDIEITARFSGGPNPFMPHVGPGGPPPFDEMRDTTVSCGWLRTDAAGRIWVHDSRNEDALLPSSYELLVSHPEYGSAPCTVPIHVLAPALSAHRLYTNVGLGSPPPFATGPGGEALIRVNTPLVRSGSAAVQKAALGRLVDAQGAPVAGARVSASLDFPGTPEDVIMGQMSFAPSMVFSGRDGRFRLASAPTTPFFAMGPPTPQAKAKLPQQKYLVVIDFPSQPGRGEIITWLTPGTERTINVQPAPRKFRITVQDANKKPLDPVALKLKICRAPFKPRLQVMPMFPPVQPPKQEIVFDAAATGAWPEALELRPGMYVVSVLPGWYASSLPVTLDSPEALVMTLRPNAQPASRPLPRDSGQH